MHNALHEPRNTTAPKPAYQISYGGLEQNPVRRRIETDEEWEFRKGALSVSMMSDNCKRLYRELKNSERLRDVELREYPFSNHAAVDGAAIADGLDYFYDCHPRIAGWSRGGNDSGWLAVNADTAMEHESEKPLPKSLQDTVIRYIQLELAKSHWYHEDAPTKIPRFEA